MGITTAQIRGARGILNWSQADLAERTGISATSIGSIENGQTTPRANTIQTIRKTFETAGIEFLGRDGMRLRTGDVRVLKGQAGFLDFYEMVHDELKDHKGEEVLVSNVDERKFVKWQGDQLTEHSERMRDLEIKYKILLKHGDTYFPASPYAEYRWLPKELFSSVPFYLFGKKLAILLFENEPTIIVLDYPAISEAYKLQFATFWETAQTPEVDGMKEGTG